MKIKVITSYKPGTFDTFTKRSIQSILDNWPNDIDIYIYHEAQTKDIFECMSSDGVDLKSLKIDGGMVENKYFNQILADVLNLKILLPDNKEATAKGAAFLASLGSKHTNSLFDLNEFVGSFFYNQ